MPQGTGKNFRYLPQMSSLIDEVRSTFADVLVARPSIDQLLELIESRVTDRDRSLEDFVSAPAVGTPGYDCYVDPLQAANNATTHVYTNIADAIVAEQPTHTQLLRIGIIPNGSNTPINDQQQIVTWPITTFIGVVGFSDDSPPTATLGGTPTWQHNNKRHNGPTNLICRDIRIIPGPAAPVNSTLFGSASGTTLFIGCYVDGGAVTTLNGGAGCNVAFGAGAQLYARGTHFLDCFSSATQVTLDQCHVDHNTSTSSQWADSGNNINSSNAWNGCTVTCRNANVGPNGTVLLCGVYNYIDSPHQDPQVQYNSLEVIFKLAQNGSRLVVNSAASVGTNAGATGYSIDTTGRTNCQVSANGSFINITLATPGASYRHTVIGNIGATMDISGPADIACTVIANPVTIRGPGVCGTISIRNGAPCLDYRAADHSVISCAIDVGGVGNRPYAFDATSTRNILIISGTNLCTLAGTDAGTFNRVITETGAIGAGTDSTAIHTGDAAGGQLSGTYPNPNVPARAGIDTTAIHTGDAAGGDLSGTFPNPTVAKLQGRAMSAAAPAGADVVTWDAAGSTWKPAAAASAPEGAGAGTYGNVGVAARVTLDANGHTTAAANVVDFSQSFLMGA